MNLKYIIDTKTENKTLKSILKSNLYISNILQYNLIKFNKILVNDKVCFPNVKLKENDEITIILDNDTDINSTNLNFNNKFMPYDFKLDILYEDDYLLIINKPDNMPAHPCASNYTTTLSNAVLFYLSKQNINTIHLITRLDKNTTGICIFAKHKYIQELFVRKKDKIKLTKEYLALVYGILEKDHDIINKNIKRAENSIITRTTCTESEGDTAITEYYTLKRNIEHNYSLARVILHTGRTHQIRVHFASNNHTLLGDDIYANIENKTQIQKYISRQALHSHKISFYHPITDKYIEIIADIPEDIKKLID